MPIKSDKKLLIKATPQRMTAPDEAKGDRIMAVAVTISLLALAGGVCAHLN